jgi:hypothetical protein
VFYGHPGFFVYPAHEMVRRARASGFETRMLPGVSSLDTLITEFGVDPADAGLQIYEATQFLLRRVVPETTAVLVLLQVGMVGLVTATREASSAAALEALVQHLCAYYPRNHVATLYESARQVLLAPRAEHIRLETLPNAAVAQVTTLVIPPASPVEFDAATVRNLGLDRALGGAAQLHTAN